MCLLVSFKQNLKPGVLGEELAARERGNPSGGEYTAAVPSQGLQPWSLGTEQFLLLPPLAPHFYSCPPGDMEAPTAKWICQNPHLNFLYFRMFG